MHSGASGVASLERVCGRAAPDAPERAYDQRRCTGVKHRTSCRGSRGGRSLPSPRQPPDQIGELLAAPWRPGNAPSARFSAESNSRAFLFFLRFAQGEAILWTDKPQNFCRWIDLRLAVSDRFVRLASF